MTVSLVVSSAAFAAKAQTSPENYSDIIAEALDEHLAERIKQFTDLGILLQRQTNETSAVLQQAENDKLGLFKELREREQKVKRVKSHLPWFGLRAVVLAVAMTVVVPRTL